MKICALDVISPCKLTRDVSLGDRVIKTDSIIELIDINYLENIYSLAVRQGGEIECVFFHNRLEKIFDAVEVEVEPLDATTKWRLLRDASMSLYNKNIDSVLKAFKERGGDVLAKEMNILEHDEVLELSMHVEEGKEVEIEDTFYRYCKDGDKVYICKYTDFETYDAGIVTTVVPIYEIEKEAVKGIITKEQVEKAIAENDGVWVTGNEVMYAHMKIETYTFIGLLNKIDIVPFVRRILKSDDPNYTMIAAFLNRELKRRQYG